MKILSWNIRQGGGSRVSKIIDTCRREKPDIIVLSEWRNNLAGRQMRIGFLRLGYLHQVVSAAASDKNSVCIVSKYPFSSRLYKGIDPVYDCNVISAQFEAFDLYGVYMPHKKKHGLLEWLTETITAKPTIVVGDFNTGHNLIDQKGDSFWYTDELIAFENKGFKDAFRYIQGSVQEYSWYSHQGNGYRYDHTYVSEVLLPVVTNCHYLHDYREKGISDHSPMLLVLGK